MIYINKESSKKPHCQVPSLPTCIALLISRSKALFESPHIWHLHVFFFFPHKSFGSRSFIFSFPTTPFFFFPTNLLVVDLSSSSSYSDRIGPNWGCFGQFLGQLRWISTDFGRFRPESAQIEDQKKKNKVANWRVETSRVRETHPCFPEICLQLNHQVFHIIKSVVVRLPPECPQQLQRS